MEQELIEIISPSGYKVFFRKSLTWGQSKQLQAMFTNNVKYNIETKQVEEATVTGDTLSKAIEKTIEFLLVKVCDANGNVIENPLQTLDNLSEEDGYFIQQEVAKIKEKAQALAKKNETTSETQSLKPSTPE